jgi:hypothetical protein
MKVFLYTMYLFCHVKFNLRGRGGGCEFYDNFMIIATNLKKNKNEIKPIQNLYRLEDLLVITSHTKFQKLTTNKCCSVVLSCD